MTRVDLSGWLLIASFVLWFPAAVLPARIWIAPHAERLTLIDEQRRRWQIVNLSIAAAAVILVLGFVALAEPLRREGAPTLTDLSLALLLLGAPFWLASLVHRIVVAPDGAAWAGALFVAWSVIANVAIIGFGAALARSDLIWGVGGMDGDRPRSADAPRVTRHPRCIAGALPRRAGRDGCRSSAVSRDRLVRNSSLGGICGTGPCE